MQLRYHLNPMRELLETERWFSTFFNTPRQESHPSNGYVAWVPAVDVSETADAYLFTAELPGMNPEAVEVKIEDDTLTIKGERVNASQDENGRYHHRERPMGRFARVFRMSKPVDSDKVAATYRDGILSIVVPLRSEAKPRKIVVQG